MTVLIKNNATSTLAAQANASATTLTLTTGEGSRFPVTLTALDFFYVRLGSDTTNEVVKVTARSSDTLTCTALANTWAVGTTVALTPSKEVFDFIPRLITSDVTVTVKTSGGDFTTLADALDALKNVLISPAATVTVEIDDGDWTRTSQIDVKLLSSERIRVKGKNLYTKTISGTTSSSGSTGAWSVTVPCSDTSNTVAGDWILVPASPVPSGGTNPTYLCGFHEITAVSANTSITFASKHKAAAGPSDAISATAYIVKTRLKFNDCSGFVFYSGGRGFLSLDNLGIVGNSSATVVNGITLASPCTFEFGLVGTTTTVVLGISGFKRGVGVYALGTFRANNATYSLLAVSNCADYGAVVGAGARFFALSGVVSGCNVGIYAELSTAYFSNGALTGNTTGVVAYSNTGLTVGGCYVTGNTTGLSANTDSFIYRGTGVTFANNTTNESPTATAVTGSIST